MHIADFPSRNVDNDTDDPHEVIPITFVANGLFLHITDQNTSKTRIERILYNV